MQPAITINLDNLRESIFSILGSGLGIFFIIALSLFIIVGVIIATCLWIDVKNAMLKLKEMEK